MHAPRDFPGFSAPAAGPEAPLAMLGACHTRVEKQCRTLERLLPHLASHGRDAAAQEAAQAVLRYFDTAAVHHHADEEEDLFPALHAAAAGTPEAARVGGLTDALWADHRALEQQWAALRPALQAVAAGEAGSAAPLPPPAVAAFVARYRAHIETEDTVLIPLARRLLDAPAQAGLGRAMARRRGLAPAGAQSGV